LEIHFQNSLVWLSPEHKELEKELLEFPNGKHDDLVDCLAYAVILINQKKNKLTLLDIYGT
jgi:phage terminase large subunit-like protein